MDAVIEEMSHTRPPVRNDVLFRWVAHLVNVVQPQLDRLATIEALQVEAMAKGRKDAR